MLHFSARLIRSLVTALVFGLPEIKFAYGAGQCGIPDQNPFFFSKDLMDSLNVTVTFCMKTSEKFRVNTYFVLPYCFWKLSFLVNDLADSICADFKFAGYFTDTHTFIMKKKNCFTLVHIDHLNLSQQS